MSFPGKGILQGLGVTAKNLAGSFHDPERFVTTEYPEERRKPAEAYRNFPFLISESAEDPMGTLRCVACQICEKECPPQCIRIEKSKDKKPDAAGKPQLYPAVFDIDISVCMSCQICVEVCPFDAIKMDQDFEIATADRFRGLLMNREQLARPNSYYRRIHPTEAAEVDARLEAERAAARAAKRASAEVAQTPKRGEGVSLGGRPEGAEANKTAAAKTPAAPPQPPPPEGKAP